MVDETRREPSGSYTLQFGLQQPLKLHIKLDSRPGGMGRTNFPYCIAYKDDLHDPMQLLSSLSLFSSDSMNLSHAAMHLPLIFDFPCNSFCPTSLCFSGTNRANLCSCIFQLNIKILCNSLPIVEAIDEEQVDFEQDIEHNCYKNCQFFSQDGSTGTLRCIQNASDHLRGVTQKKRKPAVFLRNCKFFIRRTRMRSIQLPNLKNIENNTPAALRLMSQYWLHSTGSARSEHDLTIT
jgi:hypothetical protein